MFSFNELSPSVSGCGESGGETTLGVQTQIYGNCPQLLCNCDSVRLLDFSKKKQTKLLVSSTSIAEPLTSLCQEMWDRDTISHSIEA